MGLIIATRISRRVEIHINWPLDRRAITAYLESQEGLKYRQRNQLAWPYTEPRLESQEGLKSTTQGLPSRWSNVRLESQEGLKRRRPQRDDYNNVATLESQEGLKLYTPGGHRPRSAVLESQEGLKQVGRGARSRHGARRPRISRRVET